MKKNFKIFSLIAILLAGIFLISSCGKNDKSQKTKSNDSVKNTDQKQETANDIESASKEYTISFYDGDDFIFSKKIESGSLVEEPNAPQKSGYVFVAWYLGSEKFDFNTAITSDITLKAEWKKQNVSGNKKTFTVNFVSYDNNSTTQKVSEGDKAIKPANPTRKGYLFKGWELNGSAYNFENKVTSDITITAKWQKLSTIKGEVLKYASMNHKTLKEKLGGVTSNSIKSWTHYDTDNGRGYYSGGYVSFANGYAGLFEFWTFENENFDTVLDSVQVKNISVPLKDLFNDYSSYSLTDENLKAIGAKNILRVKDRDLLQFVYDHYTIEIYSLSVKGYEQLSIWDDNWVENY